MTRKIRKLRVLRAIRRSKSKNMHINLSHTRIPAGKREVTPDYSISARTLITMQVGLCSNPSPRSDDFRVPSLVRRHTSLSDPTFWKAMRCTGQGRIQRIRLSLIRGRLLRFEAQREILAHVLMPYHERVVVEEGDNPFSASS